jgi:peptide/nickel transport system ATP-binding protein
MMAAFVEVRDLTLMAAAADGGETRIVKGVSFAIARGEVLALIGESGSGKTSVALALMGYARRGCRISGGSIRIGELELRSLDARAVQDLRGARISYVAQSAAAAFNPARTLLEQVIEPALVHGTASRAEARRKAVELFRALALPDPETIGGRYPHQVSGGQLQRAMAAMALITDPWLVIFDEPTTALDVTTQVEVLRAFKQAIRTRGITALYVSHDLAVVAQMADGIVVMQQGAVRESGSTAQLLSAPADEYTRALLAAAAPQRRIVAGSPGTGGSSGPDASVLASTSAAVPAPLLRVQGLVAGYLPQRPVLRDLSFALHSGRTLGVIGESGSGKSTLARVLAGLLPPSAGSVEFQGQPLPRYIGVRSREQLRRIQIVFQNADTALNPAHTVRQLLARPLQLYRRCEGAAVDARVRELLDRVHLPAALVDRLASGLSGGQKQRLNLARALAADPELILCDEITASLDTVVGAAILDLLAELRRELAVSYLFISHDIGTVRAVCDEVLVLNAGQVVEHAAGVDLLGAPTHPYTRLLCASVPQLRQGWLEQMPTDKTAMPGSA